MKQTSDFLTVASQLHRDIEAFRGTLSALAAELAEGEPDMRNLQRLACTDETLRLASTRLSSCAFSILQAMQERKTQPAPANKQEGQP